MLPLHQIVLHLYRLTSGLEPCSSHSQWDTLPLKLKPTDNCWNWTRTNTIRIKIWYACHYIIQQSCIINHALNFKLALYLLAFLLIFLPFNWFNILIVLVAPKHFTNAFINNLFSIKFSSFSFYNWQQKTRPVFQLDRVIYLLAEFNQRSRLLHDRFFGCEYCLLLVKGISIHTAATSTSPAFCRLLFLISCQCIFCSIMLLFGLVKDYRFLVFT